MLWFKHMRAIWSGSLSFGLVNIPVKLYSGVKPEKVSFHFLHNKDLSPIRFARVCREDGKEIPYEDIVRGYEYTKGDYIVLTDDELTALDPRKTGTVDIMNFVDEKEIDVEFFEKPYYIEPDKGAAKAYALLAEALKRSKKVAVARFVIRTRERLGVVKAEGGLLILDQIRFAEDLQPQDEIEIPRKILDKREIDLALQLIDQLTVKFDPKKYKDTYAEEVLAAIEKKAHGRKIVARGRAAEPARVKDLMSVLKKSLQKQQRSHAH